MKYKIDNKGRTVDQYGRVLEPASVSTLPKSKRVLRRKPYIDLKGGDNTAYERNKVGRE